MDFSTGDLIALAGAVVALLAFGVAADQFRAAARVARAQFLLDMDQAFEADNAIRTELSKTENFNPSPEQWRLVKAYMCRFERVGIFIDQKLLDADVVYRLYGPRFRAIVRQPAIRDRLLYDEGRAERWHDFIELWHVFEKQATRARHESLRPNGKDLPALPERGGGIEDHGDEREALGAPA